LSSEKKKTVRLRDSLEIVSDKLQQQIDEGESIRTMHVETWIQLEELKAERQIWADYTAEVLKALFANPDNAQEFLAAMPFHRVSGDIDSFVHDQRVAILEGITFLRSLRRRLPLIVEKGAKIVTRPSVQVGGTVRDPKAEATVALLEEISPELANSYKQILRDVQDVTKLSYRGTANELREILREVLLRLAPDEEVTSQPWFPIVENEKGKERKRPTHRERARYILEKKGAGSRVHDVAEGSLGIVEEGLSQLVRDMYSRTSVASHTAQDLEEIKKLVGYFDPLIHDLCGQNLALGSPAAHDLRQGGPGARRTFSVPQPSSLHAPRPRSPSF
jgi:Predicted pPIWI-associating nuclease